jgi:hypothetical protein
VTPVPQNDDPSSYEAQRKVATAAKERQGMSAQLLSSSPDSVSTDEQPRKTAATIG